MKTKVICRCFSTKVFSDSQLKNLNPVGWSLWIWQNDALTGLGLDSLCTVDSELSSSGFIIETNPALCTDLAEALRDQVLGCNGIGGSIYINACKLRPKG